MIESLPNQFYEVFMAIIPYDNKGERILSGTVNSAKYYKCGCHEREKNAVAVTSLSQKAETIYQNNFSNRVYLNLSLGKSDATTILRYTQWICDNVPLPSFCASLVGVFYFSKKAIQASSITSSINPLVKVGAVLVGDIVINEAASWASQKIKERFRLISQQLMAKNPVSDYEEIVAKRIIWEIPNLHFFSESEVVEHVRKKWDQYFPHTCNTCAQNGKYIT